MRPIWISAAIVAFSIAAAHAEPLKLSQATQGYTYFNRPGASMTDHDAAMRECSLRAATIRSADEIVNGGAGLVRELVGNLMDRGVPASAIENCMVVKGWRVIRLADAEGASIAALPQAEIAAQLTPWIGSSEPHGDIVRVWGNEAAHASTDRYELRPSVTSHGSLSALAMANGEVRGGNGRESSSPRIDRRWPRGSLRPARLSEAPADAAIIIVDVKGGGARNGGGISFMRVGASEDALPSEIDSQPDTANASKPTLYVNGEGNWYAFAVPAGTWRLSGMGYLPVLSFCMGSPAFDVAAGEVVFAGAIDLSLENLTPDLNLAPAQAWLAGHPEAALVRAASYTNGWTGPCIGSALYALEFEGAPFREGYVGGSRAGSLEPPAPSPE